MKKNQRNFGVLNGANSLCLCCSKGDDSKPLAKRKDRLGEG